MILPLIVLLNGMQSVQQGTVASRLGLVSDISLSHRERVLLHHMLAFSHVKGLVVLGSCELQKRYSSSSSSIEPGQGWLAALGWLLVRRRVLQAICKHTQHVIYLFIVWVMRDGAAAEVLWRGFVTDCHLHVASPPCCIRCLHNSNTTQRSMAQ